MTPAARKALAEATVAASTLPARVTGALARASHKARTDAERIANVEDAKRAAAEITAKIILAEAALRLNRREVEP